MLRKALALATLSAFWAQVLFGDLAQAQEKIKDFKPPTFEELYKNYSFIQTTALAEITTYPAEELAKEQKRLDEKEKIEVGEAKKEQFLAKAQLKDYQKQLKTVSSATDKTQRKYRKDEIIIEDGKPRKVPRIDYENLDKDPNYQALQEQRKKLECQVKEWEIRSNEAIYKAKLEHIKIVYEVLGTQLDLLKNWPLELQSINADLASGKSNERLFANPENIGLRDLGFGNPTEDIKIWKDPEAKQFLEKLQSEEYKNPAVKAYLVGLVQTIASNTDLKIPIEDKNIMISPEEDVNAFALPGGIISVNRGLLLSVETEAQLAGVIAHELGHVAARHSARLNKKMTIAGILMSMAQVAAALFTGGVSALVYYAIRYGLDYGLGMFLNLNLLGVSREYELEADTLGMQYVWKANCDPMSFMDFFEKMGRDKGYVRQTSFFRTHPAFAKRISHAQREEHFLPPKYQYLINTAAFLEMKARLCVAMEAEKAEEKELQSRQYRPTLTRGEQKEDERLKKDCGLQKPTDNRPSPCDDPQLEDYKYKIREELSKEKKDKEQSEEEKNRPTLKRPEPPNQN